MDLLPSASVGELRDFANGIIWADIYREVNVWLNEIRSQLEVEEEMVVIRRLQGSAKACRDLLRLPDVLIDLAQQHAEETDLG